MLYSSQVLPVLLSTCQSIKTRLWPREAAESCHVTQLQKGGKNHPLFQTCLSKNETSKRKFEKCADWVPEVWLRKLLLYSFPTKSFWILENWNFFHFEFEMELGLVSAALYLPHRGRQAKQKQPTNKKSNKASFPVPSISQETYFQSPWDHSGFPRDDSPKWEIRKWWSLSQ